MRFATAGKWRFIDKSPDVVVTLKQSGSELQLLIVEIRLHKVICKFQQMQYRDGEVISGSYELTRGELLHKKNYQQRVINIH